MRESEHFTVYVIDPGIADLTHKLPTCLPLSDKIQWYGLTTQAYHEVMACCNLYGYWPLIELINRRQQLIWQQLELKHETRHFIVRPEFL